MSIQPSYAPDALLIDEHAHQPRGSDAARISALDLLAQELIGATVSTSG
jgi:hypothetical protein